MCWRGSSGMVELEWSEWGCGCCRVIFFVDPGKQGLSFGVGSW